jgi:hypothetical protein
MRYLLSWPWRWQPYTYWRVSMLLSLLMLILVVALLLYLGDVLISDARLRQTWKAVVAVVAIVILLGWLFGYAPVLSAPHGRLFGLHG